jgi:hypothetical protein
MLSDDALQHRFVGAEIYVTVDTHHGPAHEPRLLQHQVDKLFIDQFIPFQAELLEAGAPEIEHFRRRFSLEQLLYLCLRERVFEKVALVEFDVLLRKKLLRLAAGISFHPAVKIDFHCC